MGTLSQKFSLENLSGKVFGDDDHSGWLVTPFLFAVALPLLAKDKVTKWVHGDNSPHQNVK